MTDRNGLTPYGTLTEPATLTIERLLPGPAERIWAYITDSELRRQWLAAGPMGQEAGSPFELTWRNDELTEPAGERPPGFPAVHSMQGEITEIEPPHRLVITWGSTGGVTFELTPQGEDVLLTIVHRRLGDRSLMLNIAPGWHMHLDILAARLRGEQPEPFWDGWARLRLDYDRRLPA
ncbi:SRPBCC family protein [Mesorhizobium kowhaii]|uniref:ATPase n=1 Tax=Mesorhizobium kowhaii TaxID=1300272 RepID=A0A2W7C8M9_9HYPH|nr:SRPBCC family protein [Mesorhizobium kowhaii]PZV39475.1 ATPase [Mesorhizobium kowhaii]